MKFLINKNDLEKKISTLQTIIPAHPVVPVIENILIETTENQVIVTATSLNTTVSVTLEADIQGVGTVMVQAKMVFDTLKNLPNQPIEFIGKKDRLTIKSDNGNYHIACDDYGDFPKFKEVKADSESVLECSFFKKALEKTVPVSTDDDLKANIKGVYLDLPQLKIVATDSYRISTYKHNSFTGDKALFCDKRAMYYLIKSLPDDGDCTLKFDGIYYSIQYEDTILQSRVKDEHYPAYQNVFPKNKKEAVIDRKELQGALKRINIYTNKDTHIAVLNFLDNKLTLKGEDVNYNSEGQEILHCEYDDEELTIGLNAKLLYELINLLDGESVKFKLGESGHAVLIYDNNHKYVEMLIMPMLIHGR